MEVLSLDRTTSKAKAACSLALPSIGLTFAGAVVIGLVAVIVWSLVGFAAMHNLRGTHVVISNRKLFA